MFPGCGQVTACDLKPRFSATCRLGVHRIHNCWIRLVLRLCQQDQSEHQDTSIESILFDGSECWINEAAEAEAVDYAPVISAADIFIKSTSPKSSQSSSMLVEFLHLE